MTDRATPRLVVDLRPGASLPRRDFLRLLAGVPLAIGLPALARADGPGARRIPDAILAAREAGRPLLLLALPDGAGWAATHAARARFARHLHELLETRDARLELAVANAVIVVAPAADLLAAAEEDPRLRGSLPDAPAGATPAWFVPTVPPGAAPALLGGALEGDDAAAAGFHAALADRVLGPGGAPLAPRAAHERARLGASGLRAAVDAALAELESPGTRERAAAVLAAHRPGLLATLTGVALGHGDAGVRARCTALVRQADLELTPLGTRWSQFHPGCGVTEPYDEERSTMRCGFASTSVPARRFLALVPEELR